MTDYGRRDGFVAACHGVMMSIAPDVRVVDLTHDVPPQDVRHGAVVLAQTLPYLPPCVVVGVVDPGVGSERRGIAVVAGDHVLVGPDNGLLPWAAAAAGGVAEAVELVSPKYRLAGEAMTFHGRDIFAPAAAHVAVGVPVSRLGPAVGAGDLVRLPEPKVRARPGVLETEVHVVDHFGNVALAAGPDDLAASGVGAGQRASIVRGGPAGPDSATEVVVGRVFADVAPGEMLLYVDSHRHVALAVNHGSAAARLGVEPGDQVTIRVLAP
nr:SAM-dependent chlorinase/fluorinase [Phytoactinopolyspora mesophila]